MSYIITYLVSLVTLALLDYVWLGIIMNAHIHRRMEHLMKTELSWGPAIAFYVLYTISIIVFAVIPASQSQNIYHALGYGALLGFTAYMTYDITNRATLKDRPVAMVVPDILWGTAVTAIVAMVGYLVYTHLSA